MGGPGDYLKGVWDTFGSPDVPPEIAARAGALGITPPPPVDPASAQAQAEAYRTANPEAPKETLQDFINRGIKESGGGGDRSGDLSAEQGQADRIAASLAHFPTIPTARNNLTVMGEGENYHPLGGREGKRNYQEAYDPDPMVNAVINAQNASSDMNKALRGHYAQEGQRQTEAMAAIMARRQESQVEEQRRQAVLDQQTQQVTSGLLNQGAFWSNPGNIVSAIAFSLMPIAGGDPAMGAKLINQAIESDFQRRHVAANQYLGELRSNLSSYRKMTGDAQAGDLLAESEARRVAALKIEEISQQFASPISKAKAEAAIAEQRSRAAQLRMQAYRMGVYVPPHAENKLIADEYKKAGKDGIGFSAYATTPGAPGSAAAGSIPGKGGPLPTTANTGGGQLPGVRVAALSANPAEALRQYMTHPEQFGEKDLDNIIGSINLQRAMAAHPGNPAAVNTAMVALQRDTFDKAKNISDKVAPLANFHSQIRGMSQSMVRIANAYKAAGKDPNDFLQDLRTGAPDGMADTINRLRERYTTPGSPEGQYQKDLLVASNSFMQGYNLLRSEFAHQKFGGSQTDNELKNLEAVVSKNPSWQQLDGFITRLSSAAQADIDVALNAAPPEAALQWIRANPGYRGKTLSRPGVPGR